jgi:hypothetical protein
MIIFEAFSTASLEHRYMSVGEKLKKWYRGTLIPPRQNDPGSPVVFLELDHYKQPPLAAFLGMLLKFIRGHWQWIIGTVLAIIAILVAVISGPRF